MDFELFKRIILMVSLENGGNMQGVYCERGSLWFWVDQITEKAIIFGAGPNPPMMIDTIVDTPDSGVKALTFSDNWDSFEITGAHVDEEGDLVLEWKEAEI